MDKVIEAFKKVIEDWGVLEVIFTVIFFPWSLLYIGFRLIQEYET
jgi:hypothetical protein